MEKNRLRDILGKPNKDLIWMKRYLYVFMLIFALSPFFQGLFFDNSMLIAQMVVAGLLIAITLTLKDQVTREINLKNPVLIAAFLVFLGYLISIFTAVNLGSAVIATLRQLNYVFVVILTMILLRKDDNRSFLFNSIYWSGILVSMIGLVDAYGIIDLGAVQEGTNRIMSTLEYPNTLGIYSTIIFLLGAYLGTVRFANKLSGAYLFGNSIALLAIIGSQSRATWLLFPFFIGLLVLGLSKAMRIRILIFLVTPLLLIGILSKFLLAWGSNLGLVGLIPLFGLSLITPGVLARTKLNNIELSLGRLVVSVGLLFLIAGSALYALAPETLLQRISSINLAEHSVVERGYFAKDAFSMIKGSPIFGYGGGGWAANYTQYQSYYYLSSEVHNYYLQTWLEGGFLALVGLLVLVLSFIYLIYKGIKSSQQNNSYQHWIVVVMFLALALHSALDFNLTYGALSNLFWMFATVLSLIVTPYVPKASFLNLNSLRIGLFVIASSALLVSGVFRLSIHSFDQAGQFFKLGNYLRGIESAESAIRLNPFKGEYHIGLAQIYFDNAANGSRPEMLTKAEFHALEAVERNSAMPSYRALLSTIYLMGGNIEQGVREMELASNLSPWSQDLYESLVEVYFSVGQYYYNQGQKDLAKEYLEKTLLVPHKIDSQRAQLTPEKERLWISGEKIQVSEKIKDYISQARGLLNNI